MNDNEYCINSMYNFIYGDELVNDFYIVMLFCNFYFCNVGELREVFKINEINFVLFF